MKEKLIRIKELGRGLSGCSITMSKEGNLVKTSPSIIYNNRLKKQINKQINFANQSFKDIKVPNILNESLKDNLYSIEMEYIQAESEINFFNIFKSLFKLIGYFFRSLLLLNCEGLINILTNVFWHFFFDDLIKEIWPLCRAPIVGTKPTFALKLTLLFNLLMLLKIIIYGSSIIN